jgi:hypothetical protein
MVGSPESNDDSAYRKPKTVPKQKQRESVAFVR